jgi:hypothetical protein
MRTRLGVVTLMLGLAGCTDPNAHLRPPKQPEQLVMPPDDTRYQTPPVATKVEGRGDGSGRSDALSPPGLLRQQGQTGQRPGQYGGQVGGMP